MYCLIYILSTSEMCQLDVTGYIIQSYIPCLNTNSNFEIWMCCPQMWQEHPITQELELSELDVAEEGYSLTCRSVNSIEYLFYTNKRILQ